MNANSFLQAANSLATFNAEFAAGRLNSFEFSRMREAALADALIGMAAEHSVTLKLPLQIDAKGEFSLVCSGGFSDLAPLLNQHNPRTGVMPGATLLPESSWCRLNHFDAERMVQAYAQARQPSADTPFVVEVFHPERHEPHLSFLLWYRAADGANRRTEGVIDNPSASTAKDLLEDILQYQTAFVRKNWHLLEVTTPMRQSYGQMEGGHGRMKLTRMLPEMQPASARRMTP